MSARRRWWHREVVASMTEAGMSTRAIGAALGINDRTVRRDAGAANAAPAADEEPVDAEIVDDQPGGALVLAHRQPVYPAVSSATVADLRAVLAPYVDAQSVELVAAVVVGASVLARQRHQRSSAAFLTASWARMAAEGAPVAPVGSWRHRAAVLPSRRWSTEPPAVRAVPPGGAA